MPIYSQTSVSTICIPLSAQLCSVRWQDARRLRQISWRMRSSRSSCARSRAEGQAHLVCYLYTSSDGHNVNIIIRRKSIRGLRKSPNGRSTALVPFSSATSAALIDLLLDSMWLMMAYSVGDIRS